jgi:cell division protein ZapE
MRVINEYDRLVAEGELKPDTEQRAAALRLNILQEQLEATTSGGFFSRLLKGKPETPRGVYMWGAVGRGKSMLMDLFYDSLDISRKKRVHFHAFMLEVHERMREVRKSETGDPIPQVAAELVADINCLAFDEMVVNNSADAMILSRLFTALINQGVCVVATSNRPPVDLYKDGLNREHFLPFIALISEKLDVLSLNGPTDYRRHRLGDGKRWFVPADAAATEALSAAFFRMTDFSPDDRDHVPSLDLDVGGGRLLHVPKALKGVGVFSFKRLCAEARGSTDYLAIARQFHTVIIVAIPRMGPENRNEAARFVTLVDALYEYKVKLLASAAAEPDDLYLAGDGAFEFERTASRLAEMQSDDYLALGHGQADSED